jgi:hypothetical protein
LPLCGSKLTDGGHTPRVHSGKRLGYIAFRVDGVPPVSTADGA